MLDIIKSTIKRKILKPIKAFLITKISTLLLALITISIVIGGVSTIFSSFSSWLGGVTPDNETAEIKAWANGLTEEQIQQILESGSSINPKLIPKYIEVEEKGIPTNEIVDMNVVQVKWENGVTTTQEWTKNHELMLYNKAYPYRLQWKVVAGLDVIDPKSTVWEFWLTDIIDQADELLQPIYHWAYDRYSRDVTKGTQYWVSETHDGVTTTKKVKEVNTTEYIPLEFLEKVEGTFADYVFAYKEDVETKNTGWVKTGDENTVTWTTGGDPKYDEEGNITGYTRVKHHSRTTWTETREIIVEDLFDDVSKTPRLDRIEGLFEENKITLDDLGTLTAIIAQMPNTQDLVEDLNDILIIANIEMDTDGDGSASGAGYYGGGGSFNPNVPVIVGEWTREDLIDTAMSLLDLHYFWGGKYPRKGVNPNWGKPAKVTAAGVSYTGKYIPLGLDCSGFVDWVYVQMTGKTIGKGGGTVAQFSNTYGISESELKPGDLGFYRYGGGKHVGIYIGKKNGKKMFIHSGGGQWSDSTHPYGRVVITYNNTSEYYKGNAPSKFKYFRRPYVTFANDN